MTAPAYTVDGTAASAEVFYAAACDPRRSVVVEACAGAGKTWILVSRIVRALLDDVEPQQILAITFTRRAAGEMRTRLDEWLAEWASPGVTDAQREQALQDRGLSTGEARRLAPALARLQRRILAGGRAVEVRTFHSWFVQLLAAAPLDLLSRLGLPPTQTWIEDTEGLRLALFRRFRQRIAADPALRADHAALVRRHRRSKVQVWLDAAWSRAAELSAADEAGGLETAVPTAASWFPDCAGLDDPAALLFRAEQRVPLLALARELGAHGGKTAADAANKLVEALAGSDAQAALELALNALFTDRGTVRQLPALPGLETGRERLQHVRDAVLQQQAHEDHHRMLRLSRVLGDEYTRLKRRQGLVDMADLERAAHALLSDPVLSGWVQERLDTRLRQVLIDEFQDTNPLQWQALQSWLSGYAGAGGGASGQRPLSVFIVGDPKQSIYRFRRAEPRVFAAAQGFVVQALHGQRLACDHTWRNATAVVAAVNAVFGQAVRDGDWQGFRSHSTASQTPGSVLGLPDVPRLARSGPEPAPAETWRPSLTVPRREPELQRRQQELQHVTHGIAELLATPGWRPGDVMVLARRRAVLAELSELLGAQGVPHVMPEALAVAELPEALDVIAVLDVLASPSHDLSLARALKSPLFGASDDDLRLSQLARRSASSWLAALRAAGDVPGAELQRARRLLSRWAEAAHERSPHDLLDLMVAEGQMRERLVAVAPPARERLASQAVDALLAAAIDQQGGRFATLYAFVRALKSGLLKVPAAPPSDAVQLLTVHGAKGLEARAVFVLDADPSGVRRELATLLVDWPPDRGAPRSAAFYVLTVTPPSLRAAHDEELRQAEREEVNALYVAMTRARERLVFSRTEPNAAPPGVSWWTRVNHHTRPWVPPLPQRSAVAADVSLPVLPLFERRSAPSSLAPSRSADANLGRAIHRALEWVSRQRRADHPAQWPSLARAAATAFGLPPAAAEPVLVALRAVLEGPQCRQFFAVEGLQWSGDEVTLAWQGKVLRADRVVQLACGGWWVLDYKLHARPDQVTAYREQLQTYRAALQALTPGQAVRAAFITAGGALQEV